MRVWTVQAAARLDGGRWPLRASARYVDPYMRPAYRWMARELARRVGPPPRGVTFPVWAWPVKPDLRARAWFPSGTAGARIEAEVEDDELLASDFDRFHAVLNRHYLERDRADDDAFVRALARSGAPDWPHTPALRARIEASWPRIFAFDRATRDPRRHGRRADALIQVVCWQLRRDQVVRIDRFVAR